MRSTAILWIVVGLVAVIFGVWYLAGTHGTTVDGTSTSTSAAGISPSGAMGVNGSANQGNIGQSDNGQIQQPSDAGLGSTVGENLILGVNVDAKLGTYLSAFNGMTVYTYKKDTVGTTTCYSSCATNWPPYTVPSVDDIHVPASITGKVSTVTRADGTLQVTYNGLPLYFWKNDTQPNDTTGQGVGGVWFVVKP